MTPTKMPAEISEIYMPLFNQVAHLHTKWGIYCQLYASGNDIVKILNWSSGSFFRVCQDVLAYDILLEISRLTDPKQTGKGKIARDNLTLERLLSSIDEAIFPKLKDEIETLLVQAKDKCTFARVLRNKLIAHSDLSANLHDRATLVSTATKQNIDDALVSICNVMNAVHSHFENGTVAYQVAFVSAEGNKLINRLRQAQMYCEQLRELE